MMKDITVIVCCYNPNLQKLKNTINSIINQKGIEFNIVITDDGSQTEYFREIQKYVEENYSYDGITYSKLEKNAGTVRNILNGLNICKTKYYKALSPGDYLYDELSLKRYYDELINNDYDLVFSDAVFYFENTIVSKRKYPTTSLVFNDNFLKKYYFVYNYLFLGATIAGKTSVVLNYLNRIAGKVIYIEDLSCTLLMLLDNRKVHGINEPLIWYEYNTGVSSTKDGCARLDSDLMAITDYVLQNYNCKMADKVLVWKKGQQNTVLKFIKDPEAFIAKVLRVMCKPKKIDVDISNKNKIISVQ